MDAAGFNTMITGPAGSADLVPFDKDDPQAAETVCQWLITAPVYHPVWSQYLLFVVRLRDDAPGFPAPYHAFEGSTHEFIIVALSPDVRLDADILAQMYREKRSPCFLQPVNVAHQFEATDEEMEGLAESAAKSIINGYLTPETADAPERLQEAWLAALVKTLAHQRGEPHAS